MEEWRPALGFDRYMVSDQGRVFDLKRSKYMNVRTNRVSKDGYRIPPQVTLAIPGTGSETTASVGRLIYEAFYGKLQTNRHVSFADGDPANLALGNLIVVKYGGKAKQ